MTEIKKSFKPLISNDEIPYISGSTNFCSWERLKPSLEEVAGIKGNEEIIGLTADEDGIKILIKFI